MLNHPDPVIQSLLTQIEMQRDNAMLESASLKVELESVKNALATLSPDAGPPDAPPA